MMSPLYFLKNLSLIGAKRIELFLFVKIADDY